MPEIENAHILNIFAKQASEDGDLFYLDGYTLSTEHSRPTVNFCCVNELIHEPLITDTSMSL